MNKATVEVMPDIEDGGPKEEEKKKHKKYVLGALKKQEKQ